ncbi:MAG TPA: acyl-CoA thioesterase [Chloroflexi bacterium]|jgi:acyl-CoA hydrolase|nr:hotdog domain-containing protein [Anaerolineaceae bacterium]HHX08130.1 acyl-CoA thioesterase [Chloroflexota bacterium]
MKMETMTIHHLVKSEDLNHHRTLYAGRGAEWLVEAGFIAASNLLPPEYVLCLKIHGMMFTRPVKPGEVVRFDSKIVLTGRSRLVAYIRATTKGELTVDGFITFVYVDDQGKSRPHGISIEAETEEEIELQRLASEL